MRNDTEFKARVVRLSYFKKLYSEENHWFFHFLAKLPPTEQKILVNILYKTLNDEDREKWLKVFKAENNEVNKNEEDEYEPGRTHWDEFAANP